MKKTWKHPLTIEVTIDTNADDWIDEFGYLIKTLIAGGYEDQVRSLAQEMLAEAKRRNLQIVEEL